MCCPPDSRDLIVILSQPLFLKSVHWQSSPSSVQCPMHKVRTLWSDVSGMVAFSPDIIFIFLFALFLEFLCLSLTMVTTPAMRNVYILYL